MSKVGQRIISFGDSCLGGASDRFGQVNSETSYKLSVTAVQPSFFPIIINAVEIRCHTRQPNRCHNGGAYSLWTQTGDSHLSLSLDGTQRQRCIDGNASLSHSYYTVTIPRRRNVCRHLDVSIVYHISHGVSWPFHFRQSPSITDTDTPTAAPTPTINY